MNAALFRIEKSKCEQFIRVWIGDIWVLMPIGEFSKFLVQPGQFVMPKKEV